MMSSPSRLDPRRNLTVRIILVNLALILLALGSFVLWAGWRLQKSLVEEEKSGLALRALIAANGLREPVEQQLVYQEAHYEQLKSKDEGEKAEVSGESNDENFVPIGDRTFKAVVDSYAQDMNARVTVLAPDLATIYSSDPLVALHQVARYPETVAAAKQMESQNMRRDEWTGKKRLFAAAPVLGSKGVEGVVQLSIPLDEITDRVRAMWLTLITAGLALTGLFVLASIFLGEQITRPILHLTAAAHRLATGDLSTRLDMERQDELGTLAAAFDHMADEISQLLARERALVANASHELRSPVTSIQLRAELLERASTDDARRRRYLRDIRQESESLGRLLQQLLDLDRAQSATFKPAALLDIGPCLHRICDLMQPLAEQAGLMLSATIPAALTQVQLDEKNCEIIFRNLLDNAIKYTPAGGKVHVQARMTDEWVEVIVRDTGMGVPAQDLPFIFERFYRVDKARNRTGSGLGLALVREIVQQYGGDIRATSEAGQGMTLSVRFHRAV